MRSALGVFVFLAVVTFVVYAPVRHFDFVDFDDPLYVSENLHLVGGLTASNVSWALTAGYATNWHPLTWWSHMLDVQLFGLRPGPEHVVNLVLHVANTLLLFWVLVRMTGAMWKSAFVAALFALHPVHVESVAWISERKDVLSTLFWMLTMWAYVEYVRDSRVLRYLCVLVAFALGLMAKPMLVTLPVVLILLDFWPLDRARLGWKRLAVEKLPLAALAAASTVITYLVQLSGGAVSTFESISLGRRVANALVSYSVYLVKMIWPSRLAIYYPLPASIPFWQAALSLVVLAGVTITTIRLWDRYPYVAIGWFWYLVTLLPVIGIVQVGRQAYADRYTYIPSIGIFIIVAWGASDALARWPQWRRTALAVATGVVVLACAATARAQVGYWRDSSAVWNHALDVTTDNDRAHNGVGTVLANEGRFAEATAHFAEAVRLDPTFAAAQHNLGRTLASQGKLDEAVVHYREAIRYRPDMAEAHHNLGVALASQKKFDEAIAEYRQALALKPDYAEAHGSLGSAFALQGKADEAIAEFHEALRLKPSLAGARANLGQALLGKGRIDEAIVEYREALRLNSNLAEAHQGLGFAFVGQGKIPEAIAEYSAAIRLNPNSAELRYNRGYALATMRQVDEAIADFQEAIRLQPDNAAAHLALGMAYAAAGRSDDARREFVLARAPRYK